MSNLCQPGRAGGSGIRTQDQPVSDVSSEFSSEESGEDEAPVSSAEKDPPLPARGVAVSGAPIGRGRGRGRGQSGAGGGSSSDSSLSLSPDRGVSGQFSFLSVIIKAPEAVEVVSDPQLDRFQLMPRSQPEFLPPQSCLTGLFPGESSTGRACKLQTNYQVPFNVKSNKQKLKSRVEAVKDQFGFLTYEQEEGKKLFFHMSEVEGGEVLQVGDEVEFVVVTNQRTRKHSACSVRKLSTSQRPERLISKLKTMKIEEVARGGPRVTVIRQPKGPDGTKGFKPCGGIERTSTVVMDLMEQPSDSGDLRFVNQTINLQKKHRNIS